MALTKISRGLLNTGVSDSSDATAITIDSSEKVGLNGLSAGDYWSSSNQLVLGNTASGANGGMSIVTASDAVGQIYFADGTSGDAQYRGQIQYVHSSDHMDFHTAAAYKMRLASDGQLSFNSGFGSVGKAYGVRAWARFDGSSASGSFTEGTNAGNMSSFTRTAGGNYSLTMTTAMPDTNYVVAGLAGISGLIRGDNAGYASSTTVVKIETTNGDGSLFYNTTEICIAVIR